MTLTLEEEGPSFDVYVYIGLELNYKAKAWQTCAELDNCLDMLTVASSFHYLINE